MDRALSPWSASKLSIASQPALCWSLFRTLVITKSKSNLNNSDCLCNALTIQANRCSSGNLQTFRITNFRSITKRLNIFLFNFTFLRASAVFISFVKSNISIHFDRCRIPLTKIVKFSWRWAKVLFVFSLFVFPGRRLIRTNPSPSISPGKNKKIELFWIYVNWRIQML